MKSRDFIIVVELHPLENEAHFYPEMIKDGFLGLSTDDVKKKCRIADFGNEILSISAHYLEGGMLPPTFKVVIVW